MAEKQQYVTLLDYKIGTDVWGGGTVVRIGANTSILDSFNKAKAAKAKLNAWPHLRIIAHSVVSSEVSGVQEGGFGIKLGDQSITYKNVSKAFAVLKDQFQSIVFFVCQSANYVPGAKINGWGDGPGFCLNAAAAANTPIYGANLPQTYDDLPGGIRMNDWSGAVYRFTPQGFTEVIKAY